MHFIRSEKVTAKVINVDLYGGKSIFGGREKPLEASVVSCDRSESCSYFNEGTCMGLRGFLSSRCKFGTERTIKGYTSRAKKYSSFKNEWKSHERYNQLKRPSDKLGLIGDIVVFPYPNIRLIETDTGEIELDNPSLGADLHYIEYDKFTPDLIYAICEFKPQAIMGGTISSYQREVVPLFLAHLKEVLPDRYAEFVSKYKEYDKEVNYVGRKALLTTLNPSTVYYRSKSYPEFNEEWHWDGEYLTYIDGYVKRFSVTEDYEIEEIVIKPSDKSVVKVSDNMQVSDKTVFID